MQAANSTAAEFLEKRGLYLNAGAIEVWECGQDGEMRFYNSSGELERSELVADFSKVMSVSLQWHALSLNERSQFHSHN